MARRHSDALAIQCGASNPSGVARALVRAIDEARAEGVDVRTCEAVRLIGHQLAFLLDVRGLDHSMSEYDRATQVCRDRSEG